MKVTFFDTIEKKTYEREIDDKYLPIIEQWRYEYGCNARHCRSCPFDRYPTECGTVKGFDGLATSGRYKISFQISMTLFD